MYARWAPQMRHTDVEQEVGGKGPLFSTNQMTRCRRPDGTTRGEFCSGDFLEAPWHACDGLVCDFRKRVPWNLAF